MDMTYPCTKGCQKVFLSEEYRMNHENSFDCPNFCFDQNISPSQDSPSQTTMSEVTLYDLSSPSTSAEYPCTKECQEVFIPEEYCMNHENSFDCPNLCFDQNISPSQDSPSQTTMNEVTLYDLSSPSTSAETIWDPNLVENQEVSQEVEVTTYDNKPVNIQQHSFGNRSAHDIVTCPSTYNQLHEIGKTLNLNKSSKNNRCYEDDFQRLILNVQPETLTEGCIQESCTHKTLSEVNLKSEDPFGSLLLFDDEKNDDENYGNEIENDNENNEEIEKLILDVHPETRTEECIQESATNKTLSEVNLISEDSLGSLTFFDDERNDDENYGNEIENVANTTSPELFDKLVDENDDIEEGASHFDIDSHIKKIVNSWSPKVIDEICDLMPFNGKQPVQDATVSGSQKPTERFICSDEKIFPPLDKFKEQYGLPLIPNSKGGQPVLERLQMESYVKGNDVPAFVKTTDSVQPVSQELKKRGRPRKNQIKADVKRQNNELGDSQVNSYVNYTILPDRSCKENSNQNIKRAISEASESDSSDQEYPLVGAKASRKKLRKMSTRHEEQDLDYGGATCSTNTLSHISVTHTLTEDKHQQRRKNNNVASKKSRDNSKKRNNEREALCKALQKRNEYLSFWANKLREAVEKIWKFLAAAKVGNVEINRVV